MQIWHASSTTMKPSLVASAATILASEKPLPPRSRLAPEGPRAFSRARDRPTLRFQYSNEEAKSSVVVSRRTWTTSSRVLLVCCQWWLR